MTDLTLVEQTLRTVGIFSVAIAVIIGAAYVHYRISTKGLNLDE